jgi:hypothetical protein
MFMRKVLRAVWPPSLHIPICLGAVLFGLLSGNNARANVYATDIRLNGGLGNVLLSTATNVNITYILNEPATAGVAIGIKSGATIIRTIAIASPSSGTQFGPNLVVWDGMDSNGTNVGPGSYSISITASAIDYDDWTQISDDNAPSNYAWEPRGIAVNKNPASPYYGRVFLANSMEGPGVGPGDQVGLLKLNSDLSSPQEGIFSDGGWNWAGNGFSPWKIEVADDNKVYVSDQNRGVVLSFDETLSTNSLRVVLTTNNYPSAVGHLGGPFITGTGANAQLWIADAAETNSIGIRRWQIGANGSVATNDLGSTIVQAGLGSDLNLYPFDLGVDRSNRIYTIQSRFTNSDLASRVFRFPAYAGAPELTADWKIGSADNTMGGAYGIAVDPSARFVAVAFVGDSIGFGSLNGAARVFEATNGSAVVTLPAAPNHSQTDVAWDNVGNLYTLDETDAIVRIFSPPGTGTNQATTVAVSAVQVGVSASAPVLSAPSYAGGQFNFTLNGQANVSYIIQSSINLQTWTPVQTNVSANATRPISLSAPATSSFYRALVGP